MRTQLMKLANALRKTGLSLSDALKRAWAAIRLKLAMQTRAVGFFYRKGNGEERYAIGYNAVAPRRDEDKPAKAAHPLVVTYYDLKVNDYRSFRVDRLILE